ncbi:MAG: hypothetical protein ACYC01_13835, partial [Lutibacter sp.]
DYRLFKHPLFLKSPINKIGEPTVVMFKKTLVNEIGYFNEEFKQILDYEFYYRLLLFKKNIAFINKELVTFRLHSQQTTNVNKNQGFQDYELFDKILYNNYFWLLNFNDKLYFFKRYNALYNFIIQFIHRVYKTIINRLK